MLQSRIKSAILAAAAVTGIGLAPTEAPPRLSPKRRVRFRAPGRHNPAGTKLAKKAAKGQLGMGKPR